MLFHHKILIQIFYTDRIGFNMGEYPECLIPSGPLVTLALTPKQRELTSVPYRRHPSPKTWYQGIELFLALRRLEKPAWLLNYNGNPHWVMGQENRRDFAVRMQQFFDHYLKDAPEPEWMAFGIPAVDKGENLGLELLEPKKESTASGSE